MPVYDFFCNNCDKEFTQFATIKERDMKNEVECTYCTGTDTERAYTNFPGITRASFTDGTRRKGWEDLKTEAKLDQERINARPGSEERKQITKELREREKVKS